MGRVFLVELDGKVYRCRCCDSPLALADDILSRVNDFKFSSLSLLCLIYSFSFWIFLIIRLFLCFEFEEYD